MQSEKMPYRIAAVLIFVFGTIFYKRNRVRDAAEPRGEYKPATNTEKRFIQYIICVFDNRLLDVKKFLTEKDCYLDKGSNPFSISSTTAINIIPD
jgi:hypothetical protein